MTDILLVTHLARKYSTVCTQDNSGNNGPIYTRLYALCFTGLRLPILREHFTTKSRYTDFDAGTVPQSYRPPTDCGAVGTWAGVSLNLTVTSNGVSHSGYNRRPLFSKLSVFLTDTIRSTWYFHFPGNRK